MTKEISGEQYKALKAKTINNSQSKSLLIVAAIVLVLVGFFGGVQYQKSHTKKSATNKANTSTRNNRAFGGMGGNASGRAGARGSMGAITSISDSIITVSNSRTGSADSFAITTDTKIVVNGQPASTSSLAVGDTVIIRPSQNNQNQAATIMLNPGAPSGGNNSTPL